MTTMMINNGDNDNENGDNLHDDNNNNDTNDDVDDKDVDVNNDNVNDDDRRACICPLVRDLPLGKQLCPSLPLQRLRRASLGNLNIK